MTYILHRLWNNLLIVEFALVGLCGTFIISIEKQKFNIVDLFDYHDSEEPDYPKTKSKASFFQVEGTDLS